MQFSLIFLFFVVVDVFFLILPFHLIRFFVINLESNRCIQQNQNADTVLYCITLKTGITYCTDRQMKHN